MCKLGNYCLKRMLYWLGIGLELLSACLVAEVCQASNVFLIQKEPLSMTMFNMFKNDFYLINVKT